MSDNLVDVDVSGSCSEPIGSLFANMQPKNTNNNSIDTSNGASSTSTSAARDTADDDEVFVEPPKGAGLSEEVFVVEKVLDHVCQRNHVKLLIRWEGYGQESDSWEPEDNLQCATKCIQEYMSELTQEERDRIETFREAAALKKSARKSKGKKKSSSSTPSDKKRGRPPTNGASRSERSAKKSTNDSDEDDNDDSDGGKSSDSDANSTRKRSRSSGKSWHKAAFRGPKPKRSAPTTKAALKAYDVSTPLSTSRSAAISHRSNWLYADSDTDHSDTEQLTSTSTVVVDTSGGSRHKAQAEKAALKEEKREKKQSIKINLLASRPKQATPGVEHNAWVVEAMTKMADGSPCVMLTNSDSGERRVCNSEEAFVLNPWGLCKYLLDHTIFE